MASLCPPICSTYQLLYSLNLFIRWICDHSRVGEQRCYNVIWYIMSRFLFTLFLRVQSTLNFNHIYLSWYLPREFYKMSGTNLFLLTLVLAWIILIDLKIHNFTTTNNGALLLATKTRWRWKSARINSNYICIFSPTNLISHLNYN